MARERVPAAGVLKKGLFSPSPLIFHVCILLPGGSLISRTPQVDLSLSGMWGSYFSFLRRIRSPWSARRSPGMHFPPVHSPFSFPFVEYPPPGCSRGLIRFTKIHISESRVCGRSVERGARGGRFSFGVFALRARDLSARLGPLGALFDAPKGSLASYAPPLHDLRVWA
jgi:hypothetical protein